MIRKLVEFVLLAYLCASAHSAESDTSCASKDGDATAWLQLHGESKTKEINDGPSHWCFAQECEKLKKYYCPFEHQCCDVAKWCVVPVKTTTTTTTTTTTPGVVVTLIVVSDVPKGGTDIPLNDVSQIVVGDDLEIQGVEYLVTEVTIAPYGQVGMMQVKAEESLMQVKAEESLMQAGFVTIATGLVSAVQAGTEAEVEIPVIRTTTTTTTPEDDVM